MTCGFSDRLSLRSPQSRLRSLQTAQRANDLSRCNRTPRDSAWDMPSQPPNSSTRTASMTESELLSRRHMLRVAAGSALSVVVSQSLLGCAAAQVSNSGTGSDTTSTTTPSCVLTAALTEGPYFVDERLLRSDIRTDPVTGALSAGVPLDLTFNVARVASSACTPLTRAYLDVLHCDAGGVYSDSRTRAGHRLLPW